MNMPNILVYRSQSFLPRKKPLTGFYQYVGEKTGETYLFYETDFSKPPTLVHLSFELIPHDKEQIVLSYGWKIDGKLEKGQIVYKINAKYEK